MLQLHTSLFFRPKLLVHFYLSYSFQTSIPVHIQADVLEQVVPTMECITHLDLVSQ
jgi:hypothetical protein